MKSWKKLFAVALSVIMMLTLSVTAFAAGTSTITIQNAQPTTDYKAYKLFDATIDSNGNTAYTVQAGTVKNAIDENAPFTVATTADADDNYAVTLKTGKTAEDVVTWVKSKFTETTGDKLTVKDLTEAGTVTTDANAKTATISDLEYGYYFITSGTGAALSLDSTNPNAVVYDKNVTDTPITGAEKKIVVKGTQGNDTYETTTTAQIGDTINYKIAFTAQNAAEVENTTENTTSYELIKEYTVVDTPSGLDIDTSSIKVKVGDTELQNTQDSTLYEVKTESGKVTITIKWATQSGTDWTSIYTAPANVEITYSATLTAATGTNTASINYTTTENKPGTDVTPDPDNPPTVYTNYFDLIKTDNNTTQKNLLSGAEFELFDDENKKISFLYDSTNKTYTVTPANTDSSVTTIEAGSVRITGLDGSVTYSLKETKAPNGYNKAADTSVTFTKGQDDKYTSMTAVFEDNKTYVDGTKYTSGGVNVINQAGQELPSTGGVGTTLFYIIGGLLVVAAGVLLVVRKRMRAEQ